MKRIIMMLILTSCIGLTGCLQDEPSLSDKQIDVVAERIATSILNKQEEYTPTYDDHYILTKEPTATPTEEATPVPKEQEQEKDNNTPTEITPAVEKQNNSSIEAVLDLDKINVTYSGYGLHDSYPDDESMVYFSLDPSSKNNQFLVVTFIAKNNTKKNQKINLNDVKVSYQLDVDTGTIYKPLLTFMPNDMQYITDTIKAKDSMELILVFEVSKDINMEKINLLMSRDDQARIIKLK